MSYGPLEKVGLSGERSVRRHPTPSSTETSPHTFAPRQKRRQTGRTPPSLGWPREDPSLESLSMLPDVLQFVLRQWVSESYTQERPLAQLVLALERWVDAPLLPRTNIAPPRSRNQTRFDVCCKEPRRRSTSSIIMAA